VGSEVCIRDSATLASCNRARQAAEAECERLRAHVATLHADAVLLLKTPHNHDWLMTADCPRCDLERRLVDNSSQDAR